MPWNPNTYNQFKAIRFQPFFDLMRLISAENLKQAVDIGCGTGEQTAILADQFVHTHFLGIDASAEMLAESQAFVKPHVQFERKTIETFAASTSTWDLIFSNAALQWVDNHTTLFPKLMTQLNPGGQFAVQMPFQPGNALNQLLLEIISEQPFADLLHGFIQQSPVLSVDDYAQLLFDSGLTDLNITLKVYPIVAASESNLYQFIAGSALIPYMEKLDIEGRALLKEAFMKRIRMQFKRFPAIYAFKRLLLYGRSS